MKSFVATRSLAGQQESPITQEELQTLKGIARWIACHRNKRSSIRQLAGTEKIYLCFIRELERVEGQCAYAHSLGAEATLTLEQWLETLAYFHWSCAYCQVKPFMVMSHYQRLPHGGTTAANCVPACRGCLHRRGREHAHVRTYLEQVQRHVGDPTLPPFSSVPEDLACSERATIHV